MEGEKRGRTEPTGLRKLIYEWVNEAGRLYNANSSIYNVYSEDEFLSQYVGARLTYWDNTRGKNGGADKK